MGERKKRVLFIERVGKKTNKYDMIEKRQGK
jgi:hypothetical protein